MIFGRRIMNFGEIWWPFCALRFWTPPGTIFRPCLLTKRIGDTSRQSCFSPFSNLYPFFFLLEIEFSTLRQSSCVISIVSIWLAGWYQSNLPGCPLIIVISKRNIKGVTVEFWWLYIIVLNCFLLNSEWEEPLRSGLVRILGILFYMVKITVWYNCP